MFTARYGLNIQVSYRSNVGLIAFNVYSSEQFTSRLEIKDNSVTSTCYRGSEETSY